MKLPSKFVFQPNSKDDSEWDSRIFNPTCASPTWFSYEAGCQDARSSFLENHGTPCRPCESDVNTAVIGLDNQLIELYIHTQTRFATSDIYETFILVVTEDFRTLTSFPARKGVVANIRSAEDYRFIRIIRIILLVRSLQQRSSRRCYYALTLYSDVYLTAVACMSFDTRFIEKEGKREALNTIETTIDVILATVENADGPPSFMAVTTPGTFVDLDL
ncbi:hypothetical protein SCHPADRAFT_946353 [Schizopora paradoxa]|uniref:Uncharacterized protein n=1 Tax=Schizopora paradoxa TaxID=27342 RepID=A0A0H2R9H9_9AGAM|nr:hypothetical protein SCHPADRAFT_946353 [Schizopora paradoxa]